MSTVKARQAITVTPFAYESMRLKADGKVEPEVFDFFDAQQPDGAVMALGDKRLKALLRDRDGEALGPEWQVGVYPRDTAVSDRAAKEGKCFAVYHLWGGSCEQELFVRWNAAGGGDIHLRTDFSDEGNPQEETAARSLSHGVVATFDKNQRRTVKEEWLEGETEGLADSDWLSQY